MNTKFEYFSDFALYGRWESLNRPERLDLSSLRDSRIEFLILVTLCFLIFQLVPNSNQIVTKSWRKGTKCWRKGTIFVPKVQNYTKFIKKDTIKATLEPSIKTHPKRVPWVPNPCIFPEQVHVLKISSRRRPHGLLTHDFSFSKKMISKQ